MEQFIMPKTVAGNAAGTPVTFVIGPESNHCAIPSDGRYGIDVYAMDKASDGILFTGNDFTSAGMFSGLDMDALSGMFRWDGLVHVGNSFTYIPEQGEYRLVLEAFGGDGKAYCTAEKTVYVKPAELKLDGPYVSSDTIYLLSDVSTGSQIRVGVNKPARLTVVVTDAATGDSLCTLVQDTLWNPGGKLFTTTWRGNIGGRAADVTGEYRLQIRAAASDGFGNVTAAAANRIRVVVSGSIPQKDPAELNLASTTFEPFNGRDSVPFNTGTSNFEYIATAAGRFTPDVPVTVPVQFNGREEIQTYPTQNFAIGIRRSFDQIRLGYLIYARSFLRDVTEDGFMGRWHSEEDLHRWRIDKLSGIITVHRDSLTNALVRMIGYPGVNSDEQNNCLYLNDYRVAFFLIGNDGKSIGRWNGGDRIAFTGNDGADSSWAIMDGRGSNDPDFDADFNQFRQRAEAAGAIDIFSVDTGVAPGNDYYHLGFWGDKNYRHIENLNFCKTWADAHGLPMVTYKTRDENDEFAHYYNLWSKDTIQQYYTYVNSTGIGIFDYGRTNGDFPRYSNPPFGIQKLETVGNLFTVDSNAVFNPVRGCVHIAHRETARQMKHIRWVGDIGSDEYNRYGYGEPTIELAVQLYADVWNPPFGYNNIVNRYHIWSPENTLAYGENGYVNRDRLDNDKDGDGGVHGVDLLRNAENGSDLEDADDIPESNGYLVYGTEQRINTWYLGDRGTVDSTEGANILRIRDYYGDLPTSSNDSSRASLSPVGEFVSVKSLMNPGSYEAFTLKVRHNGAVYHRNTSWYVWPGPEISKRYPQNLHQRSQQIFEITNADSGPELFFTDKAARDTALAGCCSYSVTDPIANASLELALSVTRPIIKNIIPLPPAGYVQHGQYWVLENAAGETEPRNDEQERWLVTPPAAKQSQIKNLSCIVRWDPVNSAWRGMVDLDTVNVSGEVVVKPFTRAPEKLIEITGKVRGSYEIYATDNNGGFVKILPQTGGRIDPFTTRPTDSVFTGTLGFWEVGRINGYRSLLLLEYGRNMANTTPVGYGLYNEVFIGRPYTTSSELTLSDPFGRVLVTIPPEALTEQKVFTITPVTPQEVNAAGLLATLGPIIEVSPNISSFAPGHHASIEWRLTKEEVESSQWDTSELRIVRVGNDGTLVPADNIALAYYLKTGAPCLPADYEILAVTGTISGFSRYAITRGADVPAEPVVLDDVPERAFTDYYTLSGVRDAARSLQIVVTLPDSAAMYTIPAGARNWSIPIRLHTGVNTIEARYIQGNTNHAAAVIRYYQQTDAPLAVELIDTVVSPNGDGKHDDCMIRLFPSAQQLPLNGYISAVISDEDGTCLVQRNIPLESESNATLITLGGTEFRHGSRLSIALSWIEENGFTHLPVFVETAVDLQRPTVVFSADCGTITTTMLGIGATVLDDNGITVSGRITGADDTLLYEFETFYHDSLVQLSRNVDVWNYPQERLIDGRCLLFVINAKDDAGNATVVNKLVDITERYSAWKYSATLRIPLDVPSHADPLLPLPLYLDASILDFSQCRNDGEDIRILNAVNELLPYEFEGWSTMEQKAVIWVKALVPVNDTVTLKLIWGNSEALSRENNRAVWNGDYAAVYHTKITGATGGVFEKRALLHAKTEIDIRDRCKVLGGIFSQGGIVYGNDVIHTGDAVAVADISIGQRDTIYGNLFAGGQIVKDIGSKIHGSQLDDSLAVMPPFPGTIPIITGAKDVMITSGDTVFLDPGKYDEMHAYANAVLFLSAGEYTFNQLITEPGVIVHAEERTSVYVNDKVRFGNDGTIGSHISSKTPALFIHTNQSVDVAIEPACELNCILSAPAAFVIIASRCTINGSVFARKIRVDTDVALNEMSEEVVQPVQTLHDATGNGNSADMKGGKKVQGCFDEGIYFDGYNDMVRLTDTVNSNFVLNRFTVSVWLKTDSWKNGTLLSNTGPTYPWSIRTNGNQTLSLAVGNATMVIADSLPADAWYHLVFSYDGTSFVAYSNGVLESSINVSTPIVLENLNFRFGSSIQGETFQGRMDELRIAGNVFTPAMIKSSFTLEDVCARSIGAVGQNNPTSGGTPPPEDTLTRLLGCENATMWKLSGSGTVSLVTDLVLAGNGALKLSGGGYQELRSINFRNRIANPFSSTLSVFLRIGEYQTNLNWIGGLQLFISCKSGNIDMAFIGQCELKKENVGKYAEYKFTIPVSILSELNKTHNDISIKLVLNTNTWSGPYHIDAIMF